MEVKTKLNHCPNCNTKLNGAKDVNGTDNPPKPDDYSLCIKCVTILQFTEDLSLRQVSDEEMKKLPADVKDTLDKAVEQLWLIKR